MSKHSHALINGTPIENPSDDKLGYSQFASKIADIIYEQIISGEGLVISLNAELGYGKTTCLNFIRHYLNAKTNSNNKPIIVTFNPWWFSSTDDLLRQFFKQLSNTLKYNGGKYKKTGQYISQFGELIASIPEPTGIAKVVGKAAQLLNRPPKPLSKVKEKISKILSKLENGILVIIDDIDRLSSDRIIDIFKAISSIADFPRIIYLLSFDRNIVTQSLDAVQGIPGERYLEKIIQASLDLPKISEDAIRMLFFEESKHILSENKLFTDKGFNAAITNSVNCFSKNIRNLNKIINSMKIYYSLVKKEINPVDFLGIEIIRTFYPRIYNLIRNHTDKFLGYSKPRILSMTNAENNLQEFYKSLTTSVPEEFQTSVEQLLIDLFPKIGMEIGKIPKFHSYIDGAYTESEWRNELKICSSYRGHTYFHFSVPDNKLPAQKIHEVQKTLGDEDKLKLELLKLTHRQYLDEPLNSSIDCLAQILSSYKDASAYYKNVLNVIFDIGDRMLGADDKNNVRILFNIIFQLLLSYSSRSQALYDILKQAFAKGQALYVIMLTIYELDRKDSEIGISAYEKKNLLNLDQINALKQLAIDKLKEFIKDDRLIETPLIREILLWWCEWGGQNDILIWISEKILPEKRILANLLVSFMYEETFINFDGTTTKGEWNLLYTEINNILGTLSSEVYQRCKSIIEENPGWLIHLEKTAIKEYLSNYDDEKNNN